MSNHDQAFKRLLQVFFQDFLAAFVPQLHRELDVASIQFLDKELIKAQGSLRQTKLVDLVARVRLRRRQSFILIHVEHQARRDANVGLRMFLYAAWLIDRYHLPVYPVLVTSYDRPGSAEPDRFVMNVPGLRVLDFRFRVVQLNRINWRDYAHLSNPAAAALLAKMNIPPHERVKVRLQVLRLLATLRLDPDKMDLIAGFMDTYLALTAKEELAFELELSKFENDEEKALVMELLTSWERKGRAEGREEGRQEGRQEGQRLLVKRLLRRRLGGLSPASAKRLDGLSSEDLVQLAESLLDFQRRNDLDRWLARH